MDKVEFSQDLKASIDNFFENNTYSKISLLVDENTEEHCYPLVKDLLPAHRLIRIQSGEENKTLQTCAHIWQEMTDYAMDRKSLHINLGGGVIGDMGGFCASTYKRGIEFINFPTTLLSQVDASVGGKLGIDFGVYKNHIGVFQEPKLVIINPVFLKTLDQRELRSGFAEVIKHGLIADQQHWLNIKQHNFDNLEYEKVIPHSVGIKYNVVEEDPTEKGLRKILNFGHTIGHAIESHYLHAPEGRKLHGEAIAIGMITEAFLSVEKCGLASEDLNTISSFILSQYGHHPIPESEFEAIILHTLQDKKNKGNVVLASLLKKSGECTFDIPINGEDIRNAINYYNSLEA
ncbi:3-dehydroquinate synthase [Aureibacter tunicatorum]|uniref:3-dehydroquinate synthase n=1 Tax=Aureibacter tunicatorum TaxID=866807 RepID=A0AAE3XMY5_9BACT|nr:3-dehydroquinate synthase [Aureibacter tunicatorum]MDR6239553.1 3-dehydroquinate synthase [Aureibacter tunicatorum]BDD04030.1 3-dehydroquinate synthase [Aureibacter tunicatorum]